MALLEVDNLAKQFKVAGGVVNAVRDVSFTVDEGQTLSLVGESGCGKSTTGRALLGIPDPDSGSIRLDGVDLTSAPPRDAAEARRKAQMIFQDARSSLNPRRRVKELVAEGLVISGVSREAARQRVDEVLRAVGLDPAQVADRRAAEFSGGQCQRIAIARAMVMRPSILVCDEPVASLDVSVQAQVVHLLEDMRREYGLALVFISHDLAVVRSISDRVAVMYLGRVVEIGEVGRIFSSPGHPYTRALLDSIPMPDPRQPSRGAALGGELPSPMNPPSGCAFRTRCPMARQRCADETPQLRTLGDGQQVACHFALEGPES
ncbi:peptide/nickel transport system ATP-binding protein [Lipingzhangella halophila]|uniref:Peptide/nickel transport system ATP-binding protein n=1 Tax=Lipingzhangella halophila TaxID=1783352 RepID=A0A7W7RJ29_9ACTN|nr:oligopeptide/dipeptide ABC transporter ATP-binding protein [Lipingzhangella halophila]MBB4932890.1 peptide/nickel transport system ATP-binding protein [Lipingzhangella halophila]